MSRALRDFAFDLWVLLSAFVAIWIVAGMMDRNALQTVDWETHRHCVDLAHRVADRLSPMWSYWDAGCPEGTLDGVICGWIDDEVCDRRLWEFGR